MPQCRSCGKDLARFTKKCDRCAAVVPEDSSPLTPWIIAFIVKCRDYLEALHQYLYRAKVIIYSSLLGLIVVSSIIRMFPELHPPWRLLRWVVTVVLLGVLFVPPAVTVARRKRR